MNIVPLKPGEAPPLELLNSINGLLHNLAWSSRDLSKCKCDPHIQYCENCYPREFREGGVWFEHDKLHRRKP